MARDIRTYITCDGVNSGNKIDLLANRVNTTFTMFTNTEKTPSKPTSSYNDRLPKGRNTGFAAPTHSISFTYDIDEPHGSGVGAYIDYEFLQNLLMNSHKVMTLESKDFVTSTNASGQVNVMLQTISFNGGNSRKVSGTINCVQVRT